MIIWSVCDSSFGVFAAFAGFRAGDYPSKTVQLQRNDYLCIALVLGFAVAALVITYHDGSRFYNPFI